MYLQRRHRERTVHTHTHTDRQFRVPNLSHVHVFGLWEEARRTWREPTRTQVKLYLQKQILLYSSSTWSTPRPLNPIPSACSCSPVPPPHQEVSKPYGTGGAEGLFPNGQLAKGDSTLMLNAALRHSLPLSCSIAAYVSVYPKVARRLSLLHCSRCSHQQLQKDDFDTYFIEIYLPSCSSKLMYRMCPGLGVSERQTVGGCQRV